MADVLQSGQNLIAEDEQRPQGKTHHSAHTCQGRPGIKAVAVGSEDTAEKAQGCAGHDDNPAEDACRSACRSAAAFRRVAHMRQEDVGGRLGIGGELVAADRAVLPILPAGLLAFRAIDQHQGVVSVVAGQRGCQ